MRLTRCDRHALSPFRTKAAGLTVLAASLVVVGCQGFSSKSSTPTSSTPTPSATGSLSFGAQALDFGSVAAGSSKILTLGVSNTGKTSVSISSAAVSTKYFSLTAPSLPVTIAAGQSASLTLAFTPNVAGSFSATAAIGSDASSAMTNISLSGTGISDGQLAVNPGSQAFGSVTVGSTQSQTLTVTNTGGSTVTVSNASVSGTGFHLSGLNTPLTLNASQSTVFTVAFAPQVAGSASGNVSITSDATNPNVSIALSGTGTTAVGQLAVSPGTLNLGSVVVGTSKSASGTLSASGANVTVTGANTNNSVFTVGGLSLPVTIPAGQSTSFSITFSPVTSGTANASLTVASNGQPSSTTAGLTGSGTAAPTHTVNLSWNGSTSSGISGYNVYRALYTSAACGAFSKINPLLTTTTLYTDSNVVDGKSYCYAATAVNSSSQESGYSNIASNVQIPAP
ncbi:MAG: choice-of-anchor D domain-containing protein, partial [Acidobacteriota bacterium]